jgi:hypothetical protein
MFSVLKSLKITSERVYYSDWLLTRPEQNVTYDKCLTVPNPSTEDPICVKFALAKKKYFKVRRARHCSKSTVS